MTYNFIICFRDKDTALKATKLFTSIILSETMIIHRPTIAMNKYEYQKLLSPLNAIYEVYFVIDGSTQIMKLF